MSIPFTQRRPTFIERPKDIEEKADYLISVGCRFEIEILTTGEIHMEILIKDEILAGELCLNEPEVPIYVDKMITEAYNDWIVNR